MVHFGERGDVRATAPCSSRNDPHGPKVNTNELGPPVLFGMWLNQRLSGLDLTQHGRADVGMFGNRPKPG